MRFGVMLVAGLVLSLASASARSRPSFSSRAYSGVFGSAVSNPTMAACTPDCTMKRYWCSKVSSRSLSKPTMKPASTSMP